MVKMKKIIIYSIVFFMLISFVNAIGGFPNRHFKFNEIDGNIFDFGTSGININSENITNITYGQTGKIGNAIKLTDISRLDIEKGNLPINSKGGISLNLWLNVLYYNNPNDDLSFIYNKQPTSFKFQYIINDNGLDTLFNLRTTTANKIQSGTLNTNQWYMITLIYNNVTDTMSLYKNGIHINTISVLGTISEEKFNGWNILLSENDVDVLIDDLRIYNNVLTTNNITDLYNSNLGTEESDYKNLILNTNLKNTENYNKEYLEVKYNGTLTNVNEIYNISVYINNKLNKTYNNINLTYDNFLNITFGFTQKKYNISLKAFNNQIEYDTKIFNYNVDTIKPFIKTNFINNTEFILLENFNLYFNFTDENLFAYNVSLFKNSLLWNNDNTFIENITINFTEYNKNKTAFELGNFSIKSTVWDSHTTNKLKDKLIKKNDKEMYYRNIKISSNNKITEKIHKDKISFKTKNNLCYETENYFIKIKNSEYKNHYIDFNNEIWIDDYDNNFKLYLNNKNKINKLCIENVEDIETKSIGDLNINEKTYFFSVIEEKEEIQINQTELLSVMKDINKSLSETNKEQKNISEGLNMLWWWIVLLSVLLVPEIVKHKVSNTDFEHLNSMRIIIIPFLVLFLYVMDFGITNQLRFLLTLMLIIVLMGVTISYNKKEELEH